MASSSSVLSEDQLHCSIFTDVFTDPVSTPCGHNFCMICLQKFWDSSSHCQCPVCMSHFSRRPELSVNTFISGLAAPFKKSDKVKSSGSAEQPTKSLVSCEVCSVKRAALKSCLICMTSYCKIHLEPHEKVPPLKKHKVIDPVEKLEDYICQKHERPLELFCRDDQTIVCQFCTLDNHKNHRTVPIEEESGERKTELWKTQTELHQMIQERVKMIEEIKHSVDLNKRSTEQEKAESMKIFRALICCIERNQAELLKLMEEKQKAAERQAEEFIKELEQEITELTRRNTELEQISNIENHLHLLQIYLSICSPPPTTNWTETRIKPHLSVETLRRSLHQLQQSLDKEMKKVVETDLKRIQQHAVDVILDPDTANPFLILSGDRKQVTCGDEPQNLRDNLKRFCNYSFVLGKDGFTSGRFYYQVQVGGKTDWFLGVTTESSKRKEMIHASPENKFWTICLRNGTEYSAYESPRVRLSLSRAPQKVGVFVDYEEGLVSFYDIKARSHIYSYSSQAFTEKLFPIFNPCNNYKDLKRIQQHAVDVILDPDTSYPKLILSDDGKQVIYGDTKQNLPDSPERFASCCCVLGKDGFTSGRFYYEVQVRGKTKWDLGVTTESSNRKGEITLCPIKGKWCIFLRKGTEYKALDSPRVRLSLNSAPQKVGVFVDYEEGLVSFYDVEARSHIYSYTGQAFTEKLFPFFCPCNNDEGRNSAPLTICPVGDVQS